MVELFTSFACDNCAKPQPQHLRMLRVTESGPREVVHQAASTLVVQLAAGVPAGTMVTVHQIGSGSIQFEPERGANMSGLGFTTKQVGSIACAMYSGISWMIYGDLAPASKI